MAKANGNQVLENYISVSFLRIKSKDTVASYGKMAASTKVSSPWTKSKILAI